MCVSVCCWLHLDFIMLLTSSLSSSSSTYNAILTHKHTNHRDREMAVHASICVFALISMQFIPFSFLSIKVIATLRLHMWRKYFSFSLALSHSFFLAFSLSLFIYPSLLQVRFAHLYTYTYAWILIYMRCMHANIHKYIPKISKKKDNKCKHIPLVSLVIRRDFVFASWIYV